MNDQELQKAQLIISTLEDAALSFRKMLTLVTEKELTVESTGRSQRERDLEEVLSDLVDMTKRDWAGTHKVSQSGQVYIMNRAAELLRKGSHE